MTTTTRQRRSRLLALLVSLALLTAAAACGDDSDEDSGGGGDGDGSGEDAGAGNGGDAGTEEGPACDLPAPTGGGETVEEVALVTHSAAGDAFWDVVQLGAEDAGEALGVSVSYQSDADPEAQAQLIDAAVQQDVDGIVVSMANPDALQDAIRSAVEADIPVITINSGGDRSQEFCAVAHVGQDERVAGQGAGEQLAAAGVTNVLCVIHEAGNVGLEERCAGAEETLGGEMENLQVDGSDLGEAVATIRNALDADPNVDGVLTLNPGVAISARDAIADGGSEATLATFDLSGDVTEAIADEEILFAIDQQQYLQGYLPVQFLAVYAQNLNTVGGGQPVLTGPGFVTAENVEQVAELAAGGTR